MDSAGSSTPPDHGTAAPSTVADVLSSALSVDTAVSRVSDAQVGGIALFLGVVRDHDGGRTVTRLSYSAHPTAEDQLLACAREVAAAHDVLRVSVQHRIGDLGIGDVAVVVAVGAAHRGPALACCRELIDRLKVEVPIWKEQGYRDGDVDWVGV